MYIHPVVAVLVVVIAALAGAAISFIWTNSGIGRSGKVEYTVLAIAYAVSLFMFIFGMVEGRGAPWTLPVAIVIIGSGTAWAGWRAGRGFWLVFGLMTVLGGLSTLVMGLYYDWLSLPLLVGLNVPWLALLVWLIFMIVCKTYLRAAARRKQ